MCGDRKRSFTQCTQPRFTLNEITKKQTEKWDQRILNNSSIILQYHNIIAWDSHYTTVQTLSWEKRPRVKNLQKSATNESQSENGCLKVIPRQISSHRIIWGLIKNQGEFMFSYVIHSGKIGNSSLNYLNVIYLIQY